MLRCLPGNCLGRRLRSQVVGGRSCDGRHRESHQYQMDELPRRLLRHVDPLRASLRRCSEAAVPRPRQRASVLSQLLRVRRVGRRVGLGPREGRAALSGEGSEALGGIHSSSESRAGRHDRSSSCSHEESSRGHLGDVPEDRRLLDPILRRAEPTGWHHLQALLFPRQLDPARRSRNKPGIPRKPVRDFASSSSTRRCAPARRSKM